MSVFRLPTVYYVQVMINSPSGHVIPVHIPTTNPSAISLPVALSAIPKVAATGGTSSVVGVLPEANINMSLVNSMASTASSLSTHTSVASTRSNGTVQRNTVSVAASSTGIALSTKEVCCVG